MNEKLNKKLAEFAGFIRVDAIWAISEEEADKPAIRRNKSNWLVALPNFTESLDACFKWLVPKLQEKSYGILLCDSRGKLPFFCELYDETQARETSFIETKEDTPALALCKAIEQLIDRGE